MLGLCIIASSSDRQPTKAATFLSLVSVSPDLHIAHDPWWGSETVVSAGIQLCTCSLTDSSLWGLKEAVLCIDTGYICSKEMNSEHIQLLI